MEKVGDWGPRVHVRPAGKRRIELGPWARGSGGGASGGRPHPGSEDWVRVLRGGVVGTQRQLGREVAVKEIDLKQVDSKVRDGLLKESHISHPDITRLCQAIETEDKVFIVLDHCASGDLAADIQCHRIHGRVSVGVARHFMRQLGRRLKILGEINLIHRGGLLYLDCYLSFPLV
ncbi:unnamed protein product [Musa acuminata subsp. malaccensis]|uniref:(wild Malaysian banana) hypothetical protein n=1 Tax=Musa acuminata subsp. malaccensis TaxID=214687 RepID=A0A804IXW3_MUSAM|nr:unnamed protein product [Musa acuminata subsp. malaccensis]